MSFDNNDIDGVVAVVAPPPAAPLPVPVPLSPIRTPTIPDNYRLEDDQFNALAPTVNFDNKDGHTQGIIKPRNMRNSSSCPPHWFAFDGVSLRVALEALYYWYRGLSEQDQKKEVQKWRALKQREKTPYQKRKKTLMKNRPTTLTSVSSLQIPPAPVQQQLDGTNSALQQPPVPTNRQRTSTRVFEQNATRRVTSPSAVEHARAAAGYVPPTETTTTTTTSSASASAPAPAPARRRARQSDPTTTTAVAHEGVFSSADVRNNLVEDRRDSRRMKNKKRRLGEHSPTVGGQADSQAHVAVRKAHEAAAVAIDTCTYIPQEEGVQEYPRHINVMLTFNQLNSYNTNGGRLRSTPASQGVVTITASQNTDLALIYDAMESAILARANPQHPRAANAPRLEILSRQPNTTMTQTVRAHFNGIRENNARPARGILSTDQVQQSIPQERVDETIED